MAAQYKAADIADALTKSKGIVSQAAKMLGCSRVTIYKYIKEYATVQQAVEDARESIIDFAEVKLYEQINEGNMTAIIFFLKTIGRNRGYVERQEVTGANGGAIEVKHVTTLTDEELLKIASGN